VSLARKDEPVEILDSGGSKNKDVYIVTGIVASTV